ncbi:MULTISPECIES: RelA/SpoT family protein [Thiorhodovibrio]|uniref:RelA/SpoT family protein n=1 Tax=Thiorhodovibrio TaxID=61593 RepID=UPI0019144FD3|nr:MULTISPECIES: bifunctional (p)ppGpp synthetase/guanosine-3',5'-bis(diphosphate) 3'-pyrophosphohydrolase [Thiorhodovibrio]MBK5970990.1 GTP diphosphokinase [Thiorhodovibrio winogradskyi]WPL10644.1 GTP pyrophosphokinase [Thiorhodovibrio litoralis]
MVQSTSTLPDRSLADRPASESWLRELDAHYEPADRERIATACALMIDCRNEARLDTGETEARHRLATADILFNLRMDADTLCAALLNGCLDRDALTEARLAERFGSGIARMVADLGRIGALTNVERIIAEKDQHEHEENLRRLLLGIAEDVRVVLVVLAERLHLMRAAKSLEPSRQIALAEDTERVYAPLANRLGVWQIKWELEDLALRYLHPQEYKRVATALRERRAERQDYIAQVIALLQQEFARAGIEAQIYGRPKHIYSIWKKMQRKAVDIEQIFDLRALRVIVADIPACYAALGVVHGLWKHIPREFDDYIATPKGNLYRSLHTAVIGPGDKPLEVQIRTQEMHEHAELGVAAHWAYKEAAGHDADFQRRVVWMRNWLELQNDCDQSGELLARFKAECEPSHVYVLTPQAKVIELPKGATPLDFAYTIHSEIGHRCRGARVNGRIVPLTHQLASGESVEILTQKNATPSRDWLSAHHHYMVTARARNRVRQWFKSQDFDRHLSEGRVALEKELARLNIEAKPMLDQIAPRYNLQRGEDLLAAIGRGDLTAGQIARQVGEPRPASADSQSAAQAEAATLQQMTFKPRPARSGQARSGQTQAGSGSREPGIVVQGVGDLMTQIASCCKPVPSDHIVGFVTRGRGIRIHRQSCRNIAHLPPGDRERLVEAHWAEQSADTRFAVDLRLLAVDRRGLLRDVSAALADAHADVVGVATHSDRRADVASMRFTLNIRGIDELDRLVTKLRQVADVLEVKRV